MATTTRHAHGVPGWVDLATPDPTAAKAFYAQVFGWEFREEATDDPAAPYVMAEKGGRAAAGIMRLSPQMAAAGMPPAWSTYVTVDDVDAVAGRVASSGGQVLQPPMDVMTSGRMAVVSDPAGAVLGLWEARDHIGAEVVNEHGALTWNELVTPNPVAVAGFYADVFGWTTETVPMPDGSYTVFHVEGGSADGIAGAMAPPVEGMPSFWMVYFQVDDVAATVDRARTSGAQVHMEAMSIPGVGTMATLADPQGAVVSVMTPEAS